MFTIHDYSERGLVNALFNALGQHQSPELLWTDLMSRARLWYSALKENQVRGPDFRKKVKTLSVYIEPSLSRFGNPDVVVLVDYHLQAGDQSVGDVYFIEAKLCPFLLSDT